MVVTPVRIPVTTPVIGLTVATSVLPLVQVPPVAIFDNVIVLDKHTTAGPIIGPNALMVITEPVVQPEPNV